MTPGTTYSFRVKGCVTGIFGDPCSNWSPEATVTVDLPYGPETCNSGFVWRDGVPGDHICVTPERRQKVADDFNTASSRRPPREFPVPSGTRCNPLLKKVGDPPPPGCSPAGQEMCNAGFVARDIPGEDVIVCVDPAEADLLKQENANPTANRVQPR